MKKTAFLLLAACFCVLSCAPGSHIRQLRERQVTARLTLSQEKELPSLTPIHSVRRDTLLVQDPDGRQVIIMKAVRDSSGEMVAHDILDAARVTARFRNVAERGGKVDLRFQILVPGEMQDSRWQLRFYPDLFVLSDSIRLDPVLITGADYRRAQLKGYQQYRRFLDSISADSLHFVDRYQLENFLKRNLPEVYRFKDDSTEVSDEQFASAFGITQEEALDHYTNRLRVLYNRRKLDSRDRMFRKLVKAPIVREGLRLDTVLITSGGDFSYEYVQTLQVKPAMRKASVVLRGQVYEEDRALYRVPATEPLTFYISSLSGLTDDALHYKTIVLERRVQANLACEIAFAKGKAELCEQEGDNAVEMARIRTTLEQLLENQVFDLDSIVVTASCSPEGAWAQNRRLSERRSRAVSAYYGQYIPDSSSIRFLPRCLPENWSLLDTLVRADTLLTSMQKQQYAALCGIPDPDRREREMSRMASYAHIRDVLYPRLRQVRFDFHLHRKGVLKDTVHTTVVDTVYMEGLQAIRDRDYAKAMSLLKPYRDYNAAVACCAMDRNATALDILEALPDTDRQLYLKAILYSRRGEDGQAISCYMKACRLNPAFVHRGNLDPEISGLIKKYNIHLTQHENN